MTLTASGWCAAPTPRRWLERRRRAGRRRRRAGRSPSPAAHTSPRLRARAELEPDWSRASLWWGDERCVPPEDERRTTGSRARSCSTDLAPPREVQRIRGELGAAEAAREYDELLREARLDLVLLGIGADGHTASLFPGQPTLDERERRAIPAEAKLEPFVER